MIGWVLILAGAALAVIGLARARRPWARYRALKAQEENIARYEAWRGGLRDSGPTGASVAIGMLRRQIWEGVVLAGAGAALGIVGLLNL